MRKTPLDRRAQSLIALVLFVVCAWGGNACKGSAQKNLRVAAAASLTNAFESLATEFTKDSGIPVDLIFSSSGTLTQQIQEGAPYDLFASASPEYLAQLASKSEVIPDTISIYATGRLALWVREGEAPRSLKRLLASDYQHIAIASPEHAPYGIAAKTVLEQAGLWSALKSKLVYGSNVRQAMQFAESGNAEIAIIALSLASLGAGSYSLLEGDQVLLDQAIGIVASSKKQKQSAAFISFLHSQKGQALLEPFGLSLHSRR